MSTSNPYKAIVRLLLMGSILITYGNQECDAYYSNSSEDSNATCSIKTAALNVYHCPTWFVPTFVNSTHCNCTCGPRDPYDIKCDDEKKPIELNLRQCMTFNSSTNMTYLGSCPFNKHFSYKTKEKKPFSLTLPQNITDLNDFMCGGLNRTGLLCSQCQDGLGPAILSYKLECLECLDSRYGWLLYVSLTTLPTTLLCILIIVFRFDATSASMNIFIFVCHMLIIFDNFYTSPTIYYEPTNNSRDKFNLISYTLMLTFYGIWNLDFFRYLIPPFCISNKMTLMQVIALDYTVALYPIILIALVYYFIEFHDKGYRVFMWMWRPFHRCFVGFRRTWNLKGSVLNAFATFLLLSFTKLATVSRNLLYFSDIHNICGKRIANRNRAYYDPSIELFSSRHLMFAIPALLIVTVFAIFPTLLLLFYQNRYFQKCLGCLRLKLTLVHQLARITQSCYKDGTAGTRDCRWFAGVYLLFRLLGFWIMGTDYFTLLLTLASLAISSIVIIFRPYKKEIHNVINVIIIKTMVVITVWIDYSMKIRFITLWPVHCLLAVPLLYFVCYLLYNIIIHTCAIRIITQVYNKVMQAVRILLRKTSEETEDDVVPYRLLHPAEYPPLIPKVNQ